MDQPAETTAPLAEANKKELRATIWRQDVWTVTFALPIILAFVPAANVYINEGMLVLSKAPIWFVVMVGSCLAFSFHRTALISLKDLWKGAA